MTDLGDSSRPKPPTAPGWRPPEQSLLPPPPPVAGHPFPPPPKSIAGPQSDPPKRPWMWGLVAGLAAIVLALIVTVTLVAGSGDDENTKTVAANESTTTSAEGDETTTTEDTGEATPTTAPDGPVFQHGSTLLGIGSCFTEAGFDDPEAMTAGVAKEVPCSSSHDAEMYLIFDLPGGTSDPYPGEDPLLEQVEARCVAEFESFVGRAYADSALALSYYFPDERLWRTWDDRTAACYLFDAEFGRLEGSMQGADV